MAVKYFQYINYADAYAKKMRKMGYEVSLYDVKTKGKDIHWAVSTTRD
jgi:hypothetical protein